MDKAILLGYLVNVMISGNNEKLLEKSDHSWIIVASYSGVEESPTKKIHYSSTNK